MMSVCDDLRKKNGEAPSLKCFAIIAVSVACYCCFLFLCADGGVSIRQAQGD